MKHNKKTVPFLLGASLLALSSCGKSNEIYRNGQYEAGDFTDYFFLNHDEVGAKKGENLQTMALTNSQYWNGTNNGGSSTYTPLVYKISPVASEVTSSDYTFSFDWDVYKANGEQKDGYVWYWEDYLPLPSWKVITGDRVVTNEFSIAFSSSNNDIASWKNNSNRLQLHKEGEASLSITMTNSSLSLSLEAAISVKAPYGERKGMSDEAPELFTVDSDLVDTGKLSLDSINDWLPGYLYQDDKVFFSSHPSFGRYYSLGRVDEGFKRGYLSKLYNGQLYCDGYHSLAFVCIDNNGFTQLFPRTIEKADYFVMSFRGGSDFTGGRNRYGSEPRVSAFDLSVDFYYLQDGKYNYKTVKGEKVTTETDHGGEATTMYGFRFSEIGLDASGICGIGVHYDNFEDLYSSASGKISSLMPKTTEYQFGLLLYEIMFPNASWR